MKPEASRGASRLKRNLKRRRRAGTNPARPDTAGALLAPSYDFNYYFNIVPVIEEKKIKRRQPGFHFCDEAIRRAGQGVAKLLTLSGEVRVLGGSTFSLC